MRSGIWRVTPALFAVPLSLFSPGIYREAMERWWGLGVAYLYVAIALALLPPAWQASRWMGAVTLQKPLNIEYMLRQVPPMVLQRGELMTQSPRPAFIHRQENGAVVAVVDTVNPPASWAKDGFYGLVLGVHGGLIRTPWYTPQFRYPAELVLGLNAEAAQMLGSNLLVFSPLLPWLAYPMLVVAGVVALWPLCAMLALIFKPLLMLAGRGAPLPGLMRCMVLACTPALLLASATVFLPVWLPLWLFPLVTALYIAYAIAANWNEHAPAT